MSDGYGAKQSGLFESLDPWGSSLKTHLGSSLCRILRASSVAWRERVTRFGQWYWAPTMLGHRTEGSESGSLEGWHTPKTTYSGRTLETHEEAKARAKAKYKAGEYADGCGAPTMDDLQIQVKRIAADWPTPKAVDGPDKGNGGNRKSPTLAVFVPQTEQPENWATPMARDWRSDTTAPSAHKRHSPYLPAMAYSSGQQDRESGSTNGKKVAYVLSSRWVSQLQGLPSDWCDLETDVLSRLSETPSSPKSPKSSAKRSMKQ